MGLKKVRVQDRREDPFAQVLEQERGARQVVQLRGLSHEVWWLGLQARDRWSEKDGWQMHAHGKRLVHEGPDACFQTQPDTYKP